MERRQKEIDKLDASKNQIEDKVFADFCRRVGIRHIRYTTATFQKEQFSLASTNNVSSASTKRCNESSDSATWSWTA